MKRACFALLLVLTSCAPYTVREHVPYGPGAQRTYDLYEPVADVQGERRPALLVFHGGGYVGGDKRWGESVARKLCALGWVVASANYSLAPGSLWSSQLADAQACLDHLRARRGELRIKGPWIALGSSAGAHLAMALHLRGDLAAAVGVSGPYDLEHATNQSLDASLRALLGIEPQDPIPLRDRRALSPVNWARPGADVLLVHGKRDPLTTFEHALRMEAAVQAQPASRVKLVAVDSSSHGSVWSDALPEIVLWLLERQR